MTTYLTITPRDPIIARDGRPFGAGKGIRMRSLDWPYPSVLAGAVRTMLGNMNKVDFGKKETIKALKDICIAGPLPLWKGEIYFPSPKDILIKKDGENREAYSIRPRELDTDQGCDLPEGKLYPAMLSKVVQKEFKPASLPAFWSWKKMAEWLSNATGQGFEAPPDPESIGNGLEYLAMPEKDSRVHVKIDPALGTSEDGMLFMTVGLDLS